MPSRPILLSPPNLSQRELKYLEEALESNWVAPLGPAVDEFESGLSRVLGETVHVALLNSGTSAIHMGLIECGVSEGDRVICPSFSFVATVNPVLYQGAVPVFVDSERETLNMDPDQLQIAIDHLIEKKQRPKAIIVVHSYGVPCEMDKIVKIARSYDIPVIEDAAEALGSTYKGQYCGSLGDFGVISFNGNKIVTTSAGGALTCKTSEEKERVLFRSSQSSTSSSDYHHSELGFNYRMSNICAAIGLGQLEALSEKVSRRRFIHQTYLRELKGLSSVDIYDCPHQHIKPNYWLSCLYFQNGNKPDQIKKFIEFMANANIETRRVWRPLHVQPFLSSYQFFGDGVVNELYQSGVCLPSGDGMTDEELQTVIDTIKSFLNE